MWLRILFMCGLLCLLTAVTIAWVRTDIWQHPATKEEAKMTRKEFIAWASSRGLPNRIIEQVMLCAASPREMKAASEAMEPSPPIYSLEDIVSMTDEDPFGISPLENGFIVAGGCPNGDLVAIDVANEPGSVWYISHENMSEGSLRDAAIRVAKDVATMIQEMANEKLPFDYYDAKEREHPRK
jgi:hypothetical protein